MASPILHLNACLNASILNDNYYTFLQKKLLKSFFCSLRTQDLPPLECRIRGNCLARHRIQILKTLYSVNSCGKIIHPDEFYGRIISAFYYVLV